MNNNWNRMIYKIWSPFYDQFFNKGMFLRARKEVFKDIEFKKGQKVLFVGCGTGVDLEYIPKDDIEITAIDFSNDMLNKAKEKFHHSNITFLQMDAQDLTFPNESFDIVVASLLLSVVPNPHMCMEEMIRVAKSKGQIIIFDKFAPKNQELSSIKRLLRPIISLLGTDIGLHFEKLTKPYNNQISIQLDSSIMLSGMYRKIKVLKLVNNIS